jgi:hypothetical protein
MTKKELIAKPFAVYGQVVTSAQIAEAINMLANVPKAFVAMDLVPAVLPDASFHDRQEALNRLFQRWRKLGLVNFRRGRWSLTDETRSWNDLQDAALAALAQPGRK